VSTGDNRTDSYEVKRSIIVPYVFHRAGKRIKSIRKGWIDARNKAQLPEKKFHDFRRTAARNLERANVPRTVAKQLMGHRTDQMHERYAITTERDQKDGVKRLALLHQVSGSFALLKMQRPIHGRALPLSSKTPLLVFRRGTGTVEMIHLPFAVS